MRALLLLLLPLRAPMLLVLLLVSTYLGLHWTDVAPGLTDAAAADPTSQLADGLFWLLQCLQAMVVVLLCTMPDLLLRELSLLMASSKVLTLVVALLGVITAGLYLLHMAVFSEVLVLASAVLLARLDLIRLKVITPRPLAALAISLWVLLGVAIGRGLHASLAGYLN